MTSSGQQAFQETAERPRTKTLNDARIDDFIFAEIRSGSTVTGTDAIAITEEGLYRSSNNGSTWILAPKITDPLRNITLLTSHFLGGAAINALSTE